MLPILSQAVDNEPIFRLPGQLCRFYEVENVLTLEPTVVSRPMQKIRQATMWTTQFLRSTIWLPTNT